MLHGGGAARCSVDHAAARILEDIDALLEHVAAWSPQ
jgi:hypothetical protein